MNYELYQTEKDSYYRISGYNIIFYAVWIFLCVSSSKVSHLGALLSLAELAAITLFTITKHYGKAYIVLVLSLTFSLEEKTFVYLGGVGQDLYSIYRLPALSVFPFYLITYLLFMLTYQRYAEQARNNGLNSLKIVKFIKCLPILFITGFLTGLITQLINDNGIAQYSWAFTMFITSCLRILSLLCFIGTGVYLVVGDDSFRNKLEKTIIEVLFAFVISGSVTILLGWHGYYMNYENIMLLPLASSLCPLLIVFPAFYKIKRPALYYISGVAFTIESVFYNSLMGSKFYIIPLLCLLVCVLVVGKKGKVQNILVLFIVLAILAVNADSILNLVTGSDYGVWKFAQFTNIFNFRGGVMGWYNNVDASPRFRIDEFVNILLEYIKKPWYAIFGKGIGGSITHSWGTTDWFRHNGTFQDYQIESGLFISMHESLNILFLRHGLFGLYFLFVNIKNLVKKMVYSPWAVGAIVWFFFFWGIYFSWWIGAVMVILSLTQRKIYNPIHKGV